MTLVVKIGGARAVNPEGALTDIAHLVLNDEDVVVVHGGSTAVDDLLSRLDIEPDYVESPSGMTGRFTDAETMDAFTMAMAGVNTDLVADLQDTGVPAVGLSGVDGALLTGPRKSAVKVVEDGKKKIRRGDHSGKITSVNTDLLDTLLDDYVPVVSLPMLADDGVAVNADADRAAAAVAGALDADLVVLTDVAGVYANPDDPDTLVESVDSPDDLDAVEEYAEGFMSKKVLAATEALDGGAESVTIADANANDPIVSALSGHGTRFTQGAVGGESDA
ncbi:acetylglutamate/acetylaminoadipate kinase [Salarchaeum japonicum]|uniref:Putative [LysW]-aminoadipate/[LysW]-glutamate kinase n=1 Tax=Salarchaeum japonicum TaxID=555573 RepID=A0AAV3SZ33_9EURY|nr:acetylglutamate/acetylaminoadipate kinase [Salarchaeum japonicum]